LRIINVLPLKLYVMHYYRIYYEVVFPDGSRIFRHIDVGQPNPWPDNSVTYGKHLEKEYPGCAVNYKGHKELSPTEINEAFGGFL
jgi:hypothetical protein